MPTPKNVKQFKFADPADFLRALGGLTHPLFREYARADALPRASWLFRGQGNARLPLMPKAWREDTPERDYWAQRLVALGVRDSISTALAHRFDGREEMPHLASLAFNAMVEYIMTQEFVVEADQLGFSVPEVSDYLPDSYQTRLTFALEYAERFAKHDWTYARTIWSRQSIAFAQHHGIPTRLLDWTVNPFNAAFFAARDTVEQQTQNLKRKPTGYLVVYACIEQQLDTDMFPVVRVPQAENLYLRLQGGVFTIDIESERCFASTGAYCDLVTSLRTAGKSDAISAYLLPRSQAAQLLEMLRQMGISSATLMPNADHVAETLSLAWRTGYPEA